MNLLHKFDIMLSKSSHHIILYNTFNIFIFKVCNEHSCNIPSPLYLPLCDLFLVLSATWRWNRSKYCYSFASDLSVSGFCVSSFRFSLVKEHLIEFNQLAMANAEGSDEMLNRVMTKDNIGLAALLKTREGVFDISGRFFFYFTKTLWCRSEGDMLYPCCSWLPVI